MPLKTTNRKSGRTLIAVLMGLFKEYQSIGYPPDPSVYFIRLNKSTLKDLKHYRTTILNKFAEEDDGSLFMGFKTIIDNRLEDGRLVFGPETVEIKWNGD